MPSPVAIDDPVESLFELSKRVAEAAPGLRRTYFWGIFSGMFFLLVLSAVVVLIPAVTLASSRSLSTFVAVGFAVLFALFFCYMTGRAVVGSFQGRQFVDAFMRQHRAIAALIEADPVVTVPQGQTSTERYAKYLTSSEPEFLKLSAHSTPSTEGPVEWESPDGRKVGFSLLVYSGSSPLWKLTGLGKPGRAVVVRKFSSNPSRADVESFVEDVRSIVRRMPAHPERLVILREKAEPLADEVYDLLLKVRLRYRRGLVFHDSVLSVVAEDKDGTYEFTPRVVCVP